MRRFPAEALPLGPKPKLPATAVDSPKRGELRLPIGLARLVELSRFWMLTEKVNVYRFSGAGPLAGLAAAPAGAAPAGAADEVDGGAAAAGAAGTLPNMNALLIPRLTEKKLGPIP